MSDDDPRIPAMVPTPAEFAARGAALAVELRRLNPVDRAARLAQALKSTYVEGAGATVRVLQASRADAIRAITHALEGHRGTKVTH
jgi:hypothetical protein